MEGPHRDPGQEPYPQGAQSHAVGAEPGQGTCCTSTSTCWWRPRRRVRPPRRCSSPCSAPSRCLLKCGRGRLGLKSELSMLTGASIMKALVTGPVVGQVASQELPRPGLGHGSHTLHSSNPPTCPEWPIYFPLAGPTSQHPAKWLGCGQTGKATQLTACWSSAPSPTFEGHCPDALLALDVPDTHGLVM